MALTEFILAVTLTALLFVACLTLLPTLWMSETQGLHRMEAGRMAQGLLEQQKHRHLEELRSLSRQPLPERTFADQSKVDCLLQVWPVTGSDETLRLRVTLSWTEGRRPCRAARETLVSSLSR